MANTFEFFFNEADRGIGCSFTLGSEVREGWLTYLTVELLHHGVVIQLTLWHPRHGLRAYVINQDMLDAGSRETLRNLLRHCGYRRLPVFTWEDPIVNCSFLQPA